MAVTRVLVLVAVVALCIESVLSCMCMPQHPQTDFCDSEFVLRGKILTRTPVYGGFNPDMPMKIVYNVQVNTVYRTLGSNIDIKEGEKYVSTVELLTHLNANSLTDVPSTSRKTATLSTLTAPEETDSVNGDDMQNATMNAWLPNQGNDKWELINLSQNV
ncbi:hypothetical protein BSL78_09176 [Apostichopus japonicus]|uniref:Uncharacterized protein n=1 Tax=Stichopus japonicus TaxID=307972 RepID=A0A2G8L117_STIJA|nr:hypothetical protein BSL78_09176 [Apostichopus japonicus]